MLCRSIHSKHNLSAEEIIAAAEKESIMLEHEREKDLALKLLCFPVVRIVKSVYACTFKQVELTLWMYGKVSCMLLCNY